MQELPQKIVEQDHKLEDTAEKATEQLAKLRWHWTLDETNDDRVSLRAYARSVGRAAPAITKMAKGYAAWMAAEGAHGREHLGHYIARADMSEDRASVMEAVAENEGITLSTAQRHVRGEALADLEARAKARNEADGLDNLKEAARRVLAEPTPVDVTELGRMMAANPEAVAEIVDMDLNVRSEVRKALHHHNQKTVDQNQDHLRRQKEQAKKATFFRWISAEGDISKATRIVANAARDAEGVEFTDEHLEFLMDDLAKLEAAIALLRAVIAGHSGTDWDAELANLEGGK